MSQHRLVSAGRRRLAAGHASRPGRSVRRRVVRRGLQLGVVAALVGATVASVPQSAQAQTQRVLQSVSVSVGPDGSISAISSRAVRKDGSDISSDTATLDPAKVAGDLPVRVQTSYVMGHRTGTDLSDIVGRKGTVTINVTVQNTTVRARQLSFNSGGDQQHEYALVGTPLTVVGSATLGKGDLGHVVVAGPETGSTGSSTGSVTNGVLSQASDGAAHVQWAAMLAPPRLSPSTTFTLVEDTAKFSVPTFDFNVQPGLSTDTSVQSLVNQAFAEDGTTAQLESKTISLIGDVNNVLSEAGVQLGQIQNNLSSSADAFGTKTVADLQTGREQVDQHLTSVVGNLQQLRGDIADRLHTGQSTVLQSLDQSLAGVIAVVGTPDEPMPVLTQPETQCAATVPVVAGDSSGLSVLQELRVVGAQLSAIGHSMPACQAQIKASLEATIGNASQSCPAMPPAGGALSAICTLRAARTEIGQQSSAVAGLGASLHQDVASLGVTGLAQTVTSLTSQVVDAQTTANGLVQPGSTPGSVTTEIDPLIAQLTDLKTSLGSVASTLQGVDLSPLLGTYSQLAGLSSQQLSAFGSAGQSGSLYGITSQLSSALGVLCPFKDSSSVGDLPTDFASTPLGQVLTSLLGKIVTSCDSATGALGQLGHLLDADQAAWTSVNQAASNTTALQSAQTSITGLQQQVGSLQSAVDQALSDSGEAAKLRSDLIALQSKVALLYTAPTSTTPSAPSDPSTPSSPTGNATGLNAVQSAVAGVQANAGDLDKSISDGITGLQQVFSQSQADIDTKVLQTDNARASAESTVDQSISSLSQALASSRGQLLAKSSRGLATARSDVAAGGQQASSTLGSATDDVIASIASSVDAADTDLTTTNQQLAADLGKVLVDLGTRHDGGTGILGTLTSSAVATSASSHDLALVTQTAEDFRHVRSAELDDVYLQQEQTDAALAQQRSFPAFAMKVPDGTHVLTVFSFHLAG